jgi:Mn-dependent DtxR family transcriptional regulator
MGRKFQSHSLTPSQENYLEWVYRFSLYGEVRVSDIAKKLGVSLPSVSRAVSTLSDMDLIIHESYGKISLTERGREAGRSIVRRDECITRLLVDVLGMQADSADKEVHRLEHMISPDVLIRLEALVEHAVESEEWLAALESKILQNLGSEPAGVEIGMSPVHKGNPDEKE